MKEKKRETQLQEDRATLYKSSQTTHPKKQVVSGRILSDFVNLLLEFLQS